MENGPLETKIGTWEMSIHSEKLEELLNKIGLYFYGLDSKSKHQWPTHSNRKADRGKAPQPLADYRTGPSCYSSEWERLQRLGSFSRPDTFVTETETPGGSCMNCHNNLQGDWSMARKLHMPESRKMCVCVCIEMRGEIRVEKDEVGSFKAM